MKINHLLKLKLIFPIYIIGLIDTFHNYLRNLIEFLWGIICIDDGQYIHDDINFKSLIWFDVYFKDMFVKSWHLLKNVIIDEIIVGCQRKYKMGIFRRNWI